MAASVQPKAFKVPTWSRWRVTRRLTDTFRRNAATPRKMAGKIDAMFPSPRNSSERYLWEIWSPLP